RGRAQRIHARDRRRDVPGQPGGRGRTEFHGARLPRRACAPARAGRCAEAAPGAGVPRRRLTARRVPMSPRQGLLAFALAAIAAVLLVRGCDDAPMPDPVPTQAAPVSRDDNARAAARPQAQAEAALRQRHDAAMRAAVSTLHRYLATLPEDRAAADAFWSGGPPPGGASAAALRQLPTPPSHFRSC